MEYIVGKIIALCVRDEYWWLVLANLIMIPVSDLPCLPEIRVPSMRLLRSLKSYCKQVRDFQKLFLSYALLFSLYTY